MVKREIIQLVKQATRKGFSADLNGSALLHVKHSRIPYNLQKTVHVMHLWEACCLLWQQEESLRNFEFLTVDECPGIIVDAS